MGKIISRVRQRKAEADRRAEFSRAAMRWRESGYELRQYGSAPPVVPPEMDKVIAESWGISEPELRQPEEQAKNEAMRQRVDELPMSKQP